MKKKSKPKRQWREGLVHAMEIPGDLAYAQPVITIIGCREITVENYKSIRKFTETLIQIQTKEGLLTIEGERLSIPWYEGGELKVAGSVRHIHLNP